MNTQDIDRGLQALSESLDRLKTQAAWLALEQDQWRPGDRPLLSSQDRLVMELRVEHTRFVARAGELRRALNHRHPRALSAARRRQLRRCLYELEREVRTLGLHR